MTELIRVFHDKKILRISVRLSDRSEVTQHKINVVKHWPQWGLNSQPPDHQSPALPTVYLAQQSTEPIAE